VHARQSQHLVDRIVIEATDAGRASAGGLRFEIEDLPDQATLPEETTVEPVTMLAQRRLYARDHAQAEEPVGRDVLIARQPIGGKADVGGDEQKQVVRVVHAFPQELGAHTRAELVQRARIAKVGIQTWQESLHAMDEQREVDLRRPVDRVPGRRTGVEAAQQRLESRGRQR